MPRYSTSARAPSCSGPSAPRPGSSWHGRVEKIGTDQLLNVSKVWIVPIGLGTASIRATTGTRRRIALLPGAYSAVCLDMTVEHRQLLQSTFTSLLGAAR